MADAEIQDAFMYFDGGKVPIQGSTTDKDLSQKSAFELLSFSIMGNNSTNIGSSRGGGGGAGKVMYEKISCTKFSDKSSVQLFQAMSTGTHYPEVFIELRRNGHTYLKFCFKQCLVSDMTLAQGGNTESIDNFILDYGAVKIEYWDQDTHGNLKKVSDMMWSRVLNTNEYST
ncbi:type VI secretion system tube protein Hcp [Pseudooceanicola sp. C21-150M6]|uniref:type VI secretion system tube protein Hcp n=1 Tax=Pseudooceanicola sp. C21-150M6 TaxID=3434355 RepID=UPI003D7FC008